MSKSGEGCEEWNNNSFNDNGMEDSLSSCFFKMSPKQLVLLSSLVGILLIDNLDLNQQNSLGNFIVDVGQAILTAAAQGQLLKSSESQNDNSQNDDVRKEIQVLKKQISALEKEMNKQS